MPAERITNTTYSWGNDINASQANYGGGVETTNVGQYAPNPWGFYDMHGNVLELTADWYGSYSNGSVIDPLGAASGSSRVIRGGSWYSPGTNLRSAKRRLQPPELSARQPWLPCWFPKTVARELGTEG